MASNPWLKISRPHPEARLRLFCLPFAGGGASTFQQWHKLLPAHVEVAAYAFPGREGRIREPSITRLDVLIENLVNATLPYLDKPFVIFGHSMGAFISYELIKALEKKGFKPECLIVSGSRAPHVPEEEHKLYLLPDDELIEQLSTRYHAIPEMFLNDKAFMALLLPILRADIELIETYIYQETKPLDCPIFSFGSVDDPETTLENVESWRQYTHTSFATKMFPGGHFYINTQQEVLLKALSEILNKVSYGNN